MTYYGTPGDVNPRAGRGIGACGYTSFDSPYFLAMNAAAYSGSCGYCAKMEFEGRCVVAPIVDLLPSRSNGVDVSIQVFSELVGSRDRALFMGVAQVDFDIVVCPRRFAHEGTPFTTDSDPCGGSSSPAPQPAPEPKGEESEAPQPKAEEPKSQEPKKEEPKKQESKEYPTKGTCVDGKLWGFPCCKDLDNVRHEWVDKNGYKYGWENDEACIKPMTKKEEGTGFTIDGTKCYDGKLWGFPCCKDLDNVRSDWVDKNGYKYGWENGKACIKPKSAN
jgi:hypothetical protein